MEDAFAYPPSPLPLCCSLSPSFSVRITHTASVHVDLSPLNQKNVIASDRRLATEQLISSADRCRIDVSELCNSVMCGAGGALPHEHVLKLLGLCYEGHIQIEQGHSNDGVRSSGPQTAVLVAAVLRRVPARLGHIPLHTR